MAVKEPSPRSLFALMEMAFKATQDSLKEGRWQQEAVAMGCGAEAGREELQG